METLDVNSGAIPVASIVKPLSESRRSLGRDVSRVIESIPLHVSQVASMTSPRFFLVV